MGGRKAHRSGDRCHQRHKAALSVAASGDISPKGREGKGAKAGPRAAAAAAVGGTEATAERRTGETPVPPKT